MAKTPLAALNYLKVNGKVAVGNAMPTRWTAGVEDARDLNDGAAFY
jgi:hypothetical protein